ncbi:uncharacterized protein TNIN_98381 [Trichonephila inaurata madagascariensis]|uniref:Uncharacterized protein n=1 Tax=Trichonephila inaurata madagascariensis TaxID=2747483 RepID=A0A8X7CCS0_9ARAC|nr:uncharacterized protein TNIN_98381 [Trichonephila inaurata madagascariensis]
MSPTQVRTISEYGDWIVVTCADINRFEKDMKKMSIDNFSQDYEKKKKVQVGEYQEAFKSFGTSELIENTDEQQNVFNIIQRFICNVYNAGNVIDVDAARLQMFIDLYTISDVNEDFDRKKLRNFDACNLPPCKSELLQQFLRANYTCTIWNNAHLKNPGTYQPENNGWAFENDK